MDATNETINTLLRKVICLLSQPNHEKYYLLVIGGLIGFLSSISIYYLQERKKKIEKFSKYIVDVYALMEEMRHNAIAIRTEKYLCEYLSTKSALEKGTNIFEGGLDPNVIWINDKVDSRLRDREILSSRLTSKIAEHNIYFGEKEEIKEAFKKLREFDFSNSFFLNFKNVEELKAQFNPEFPNRIKVEMEKSYSPILFDLVNKITNSVNNGRETKLKSFIKRFNNTFSRKRE